MSSMSDHLAHEALYAAIAQVDRLPSPRVADAFRATPWRPFLPEGVDATQDRPVLIAGPEDAPLSTASQPSLILRMIDLLEVGPTDRVLEVGTASGYQAAILSQLAARVVTIDVLEEVATHAVGRLEAAGCANVRVAVGDGAQGFDEEAPYDAIVITAAASSIAPAWHAQLREGGRLLLPLQVGLEPLQSLTRFVRRGDELVGHSLGPVGFVPLQGAHGPRTVHEERGEAFLVRSLAPVPPGLLTGPPALERRLGRVGLEGAGGLQLTACFLGDGRFTVAGPPEGFRYVALLPTRVGFMGRASGLFDGASAAAFVGLDGPAGVDRETELGVVGFGPRADELADHLEALFRAWEAAGSPRARDVELRWSADRGLGT